MTEGARADTVSGLVPWQGQVVSRFRHVRVPSKQMSGTCDDRDGYLVEVLVMRKWFTRGLRVPMVTRVCC